MPNIITQSVIKAKNQNSKKTAQPTNPVGRVRQKMQASEINIF